MTSKEKLYSAKRQALLRSISLVSADLAMLCKKGDLRRIDLPFLKKTEQELRRYHDLLIGGSEIPIKEGKSSE